MGLMEDLMIIPAAGRGTRLASDVPKVLFPVLGRPMLDYLLDRYAPHVGCFVVVVHPSFRAEVERYCAGRSMGRRICRPRRADGHARRDIDSLRSSAGL